MTRKDRVRQAVSIIRAQQSGQWMKVQGQKVNPVDDFDLSLIDKWIEKMKEHEKMWNDYFAYNNVKPLRIYYEDLAQDFSIVLNVLTFCGVSVPEDLNIKTRMLKQSDEVTDAIVKRYHASLT